MRNPETILDAILSLPDIADYWPQVSRDGAWIAWTWLRIGTAANVYVASSDGSCSPLRLSATDEETHLVSWTPDSRAVIVAQDKGGDERYQLFHIAIDCPGVMKPLTEAEPDYFIQGGELHPNGRWLIYAANYDFNSGRTQEQHNVYRHDLKTGQILTLAKPQKAAFTNPQLSPTGDHVLYTRKDIHPAGRQVWMVDIEGQNDRELFNLGADQKVDARWLPDGSGVVILAQTGGQYSLGHWDFNSSQIRWLIKETGRDIETVFLPFGERRIVLLENHSGRIRASLVDPQADSADENIEWFLPETPGTLIPLAPTGSAWVGVSYSARYPKTPVRFSLKNPSEIFSLAPVWEKVEISPHDLVEAQDFHWKSCDGLDIHGWLYQPKRESIGAIVYVHGGPTWHSQAWLNEQIQFFTSQGFTVLDPNYRGSTGYGLTFKESIRQDGWGGREQDDIRTGIETMIATGLAQPGKIGITGTSYGGYSSWFAITHFPPEIVAAAAPICGMTDLVVDYETTRPDIRPYSEEMMGGSPTQVPQLYHDRSPIHFVQNIRGRLLIVQGGQDPNVTPQNVHDVVVALEHHGIPYELLIFEDEGHGIHKQPNQRRLLLRLMEFFKGMVE